MKEPAWLKTISNHAVIKKSELQEWLGVNARDLKVLIEQQGLPLPRFGAFRSDPSNKKITSACRWRVGDVRAWLEGSSSLQKELSTEIGAERSRYTKNCIKGGYDGMGKRIKPSDTPPIGLAIQDHPRNTLGHGTNQGPTSPEKHR